MSEVDSYLYVIVALLPIAAGMVVFQVNPYHALVVRGVLGAIAALTYTVLGAPDVALTEALVGTLLAITLYAVTVRSSFVVRLGVLQAESQTIAAKKVDHPFYRLLADLRTIFRKRYVRLELVSYPSAAALYSALMSKDIHATCVQRSIEEQKSDLSSGLPADLPSDWSLGLSDAQSVLQPYRTVTRIQRLYDIMQSELPSHATVLNYVQVVDVGEKPS